MPFYDHPETGRLHFRCTAGGHGGGKTGVFDGIATPEDIREYPDHYHEYQRAKRAAAVTAEEAALKAAEPVPEPIAVAEPADEIAADPDAPELIESVSEIDGD